MYLIRVGMDLGTCVVWLVTESVRMYRFVEQCEAMRGGLDVDVLLCLLLFCMYSMYMYV